MASCLSSNARVTEEKGRGDICSQWRRKLERKCVCMCVCVCVCVCSPRSEQEGDGAHVCDCVCVAECALRLSRGGRLPRRCGAVQSIYLSHRRFSLLCSFSFSLSRTASSLCSAPLTARPCFVSFLSLSLFLFCTRTRARWLCPARLGRARRTDAPRGDPPHPSFSLSSSLPLSLPLSP